MNSRYRVYINMSGIIYLHGSPSHVNCYNQPSIVISLMIIHGSVVSSNSWHVAFCWKHLYCLIIVYSKHYNNCIIIYYT